MKNIRIIHTNDIHSKYDKLLKMATVVKSLRTDNSLILDAGDFNDYSSPYTYISKGYIGLKILNDLSYSALCIGNNEGFQNIDVIETAASYGMLDVLSCNLCSIDNKPINGVKSSIIKVINGVRFLIIGVSPFRESYNVFYRFHDVLALNPNKIIKKEIKDNEGLYDFVILLSHVGLKEDMLLCQDIKDIDIIIGGHSHHVMNIVKINNKTIIHQSGCYGSNVGYMDLTLDVENRKITGFNGENIEINESILDDPEISKQFEALKHDAQTKAKEPLYMIPCDLISTIDTESNFTNIIADYMYKNYGGDLAIINSGLTAKSLKKGYISEWDLLSGCNNPLQVSIMEVKGKVIKDAIILASDSKKCHDTRRRPGYRNDYLGKIHVSFNTFINKNLEVFINNKPIEEEKYYKVITTDYFLRGMGYEMFSQNINGTIMNKDIYDLIKEALEEPKTYEYIDVFRWE